MSENPVYILCIETANAVTSVAISKDGSSLSTKEIFEPNKAAATLHLLIEDLLAETKLTFQQLHAVAVSAGPGSYTGLRIATAAAKGYCYALGIPLIAVSTLESMVKGVQTRYKMNDFDEYVPMIDARRMEVFTSFFNKSGEKTKAFSNLVIDENFEDLFYKDKKYLIFGNGAFKVSGKVDSESAIIYDEFISSAVDLCQLSFSKFVKSQYEDMAYFEPNYTKQVHTTEQVKSGV
ncbi:MAG TPA: tRNA (adenosine(37)-N6)-threonylcarbamoyltransferase complex dimerization subunit type 1 TsaB [Chitinophagales bacterium]|nr:tRNA (adenosine(37)-N6)-threonylcarbamoyltransferase complex dimerization subunit type 1 TsaB [Chitinophagales bacterium]